MKKLVLFSLLIGLTFQVISQENKMRTRLLTSLTNVEVEKYLNRNDVIFIPVGPTEVHGRFPLDCEYVSPLAFAMKMAEKVDGLVLPNLSFFYPGATQIGKGTVHTSCSEGTEYLKTIAHSLLRQGFKTQIYITCHGPASAFMQPFYMDFFHETQVPLLWLNEIDFLRKVGGLGTLDKIMYGSYSIVGRLNDIPLTFDGIDLPEDYKPYPTPYGVTPELQKLFNASGSTPTMFYYDSQFDHGGVPRSITAAEREQWAKEGEEMIVKVLEGLDINEIVNALKVHRQHTEKIVGKYDSLLDF
jgi:creatinine amidohydrolase